LSFNISRYAALIPTLCLLWTPAVFGEKLVKTIETHLQQQLGAAKDGTVVSVDASATQISKANLCLRLAAYNPPGQQLAGRMYVGVRCSDASTWRMWVPVRIQRFGQHAVTARALPIGKNLTDADLTMLEGDLAALPPDAVIEKQSLLGKELTQAVPAGSLLRVQQVRLPRVIRRGQAVSVSIRGKGYEVSSRGVAINDGGIGEMISVRMVSGATLTGRGTGIGRIGVNQ